MSKRAVGVSVAVVIVVAAAVAAAVLLYTPTITIHVVNDTAQQVTVSSCGSDPVTADPGGSVSVDPNPNDARAACIIYKGSSSRVIGCLPIPTTRNGNEASVKVSAMEPRATAANCGD